LAVRVLPGWERHNVQKWSKANGDPRNRAHPTSGGVHADTHISPNADADTRTSPASGTNPGTGTGTDTSPGTGTSPDTDSDTTAERDGVLPDRQLRELLRARRILRR
jgi:hypothetical protein